MNLLQRQHAASRKFVQDNLKQLVHEVIERQGGTPLKEDSKMAELEIRCSFADVYATQLAVDLVKDAALRYVVKHT
jgi:hypothetical protein